MILPTIVKVQRPMVSNDPRNAWLVYAHGRKRVQEIPQLSVPHHVVKKMGNDYKAYFNATWDEASGWKLLNRVEDEYW